MKKKGVDTGKNQPQWPKQHWVVGNLFSRFGGHFIIMVAATSIPIQKYIA
jgi:hypothetical protein